MYDRVQRLCISLYRSGTRHLESTNDYFKARYMASSMGRFMSPDNGSDQSSADPQSLNLYSYVRNNPLRFTDPSGHCRSFVSGGSACGNKGDGGAECSLDGIDIPCSMTHSNAIVPCPNNQCFANNEKAQQQSSGSSGPSLFSRIWNGIKSLFGQGSQEGQREEVTHQIFFSSNATAGLLSQSYSYVPGSGTGYYNLGGSVGGSSVSLTIGLATDANEYLSGLGVSVCGFDGLGGCGGFTSNAEAVQVGVGVGGRGIVAGYGLDPVQALVTGMVEGEPVDPLATNVGGIYMEDEAGLWNLTQ